MSTTDRCQNEIPADLNSLVSTHELLCRVFEAVEAVSWSCNSQTEDKVRLTLLTYSYSTGLYGSMEIESALNLDPALRYISRGHFITADDLRSFRRRHSRVLEAALAALYLGVANNTLSAWETARNRLQLAVRTDSTWLDA